jgi:hypothetical protein
MDEYRALCYGMHHAHALMRELLGQSYARDRKSLEEHFAKGEKFARLGMVCQSTCIVCHGINI